MLAKQYEQMTGEVTDKKKEEKSQQLNYEYALLEYNKERMQEQKNYQQTIRQQNRERADEYTQIDQHRRQRQKADKHEAIQQQQQLMQDKVLREQIREMEYRKVPITSHSSSSTPRMSYWPPNRRVTTRGSRPNRTAKTSRWLTS